jgi:hypothetical protein
MVDRTAKAELLHRLCDNLRLELRDKIPASDLSRVTRVLIGRYTGDISGITLTVHGDHPLGFGGRRHDATAEGFPRTLYDRPFELPPETIGGSRWELWFGTVQIRMLKELRQALAYDVIEMVAARTSAVIDRSEHLLPLSDDFGCRVFYIGSNSRYGYRSGSDDTSVTIHWVDWTARATYPRTR